MSLDCGSFKNYFYLCKKISFLLTFKFNFYEKIIYHFVVGRNGNADGGSERKG